ncbi:MAG TPA: MDR family MFS transporter [Solirubrobacteraceae bacterium]|jgi:EmrB/QacA subfamily drug resistance transporter|nr:MDR family MFS transporter [Solirubrobacteraceae bacterium]
MAQSGNSDKLDRGILLISSVVIVGAIMSILDTTIVNVALATLGRDLHSSLDTIQWVSTGYLVALAVVIPMTGWASERFGAKRLWITVVALFMFGSALSGLAWSAGSLIFFRVLQGLGGGMIMPAGMSILAQSAGPQRIGRVMSVVGAPMLLGPILGPVLGGLILQGLSWRWIFYVNVPIGAVALVLAWRILPHVDPRPGERLDFVGLALLSPGLAGIVFGLSEIAAHGGISYVGAWAPILAGVLLVLAFVVHALRTRVRPLLDLRLFRAPGFGAAAAVVLLVGGSLFGAMLVIPLYLQVDRGASTLATGLLMAPQGIGAALVMPISGRLTDRIGGGPVVMFGLVVMTLGSVGLTAWGAHTSYWATSGILVARGIGLGCCFMPAMAAAYATIDRPAIPRATTALNVLQRVGGSVGTALLAVVLQDQIKAQLPHAPGIGAGTIQPVPPAVRERIAVPLAHAFNHTFWWAVALTAIGVIPGVVLAIKGRIRGPHAAPGPPVHAPAGDGVHAPRPTSLVRD